MIRTFRKGACLSRHSEISVKCLQLFVWIIRVGYNRQRKSRKVLFKHVLFKVSNIPDKFIRRLEPREPYIGACVDDIVVTYNRAWNYTSVGHLLRMVGDKVIS